MIYQKLLIGRESYFVSLSSAGEFENHRHHEIELHFCLQGEYNIICEKKEYTLTVGDIALIPPMAAHSIPKQSCKVRKNLIIELGYVFLGEVFKFFSNGGKDCIIMKNNEQQSNPVCQDLKDCFMEIAEHKKEYSLEGELLIKANLYRIGALLFMLFNNGNTENIPKTKNSEISKIDKALEAIYNRYYEPLSVEQVSALCGYNKSNFCKVFKDITGDTFHQTLNRYRVEIACVYLRESNYTIEEISLKTGFLDSKSFCRVFKKAMGMSAGQYRKNK